MDELHELVELERIKQLKARYFRAVDLKDWPLMTSLFTKDFTSLVAEIERGAAELVESARLWIGPARSVHNGHMPDIEFDGPDRAHGTWAMDDLVIWPDTGDGERIHHGYGYYIEEYQLVDGAWLISSMTLERLFIDLTVNGAPVSE